jgi:hypothetical protein
MAAVENTEGLPFVSRPVDARVAEEAPAPSREVTPPTQEQAHAVDAVFAQPDPEEAEAEGWIGLWMGGMLLNELQKDARKSEEEEDQAEGRQPKLRKDED